MGYSDERATDGLRDLESIVPRKLVYCMACEMRPAKAILVEGRNPQICLVCVRLSSIYSGKIKPPRNALTKT